MEKSTSHQGRRQLRPMALTDYSKLVTPLVVSGTKAL